MLQRNWQNLRGFSDKKTVVLKNCFAQFLLFHEDISPQNGVYYGFKKYLKNILTYKKLLVIEKITCLINFLKNILKFPCISTQQKCFLHFFSFYYLKIWYLNNCESNFNTTNNYLNLFYSGNIKNQMSIDFVTNLCTIINNYFKAVKRISCNLYNHGIKIILREYGLQ